MKALKDNIQIMVIMTTINFVVLWNYVSNGKTLHGIGYFIFFYVAILTIHFFTERIAPKNEIEVKEPKKELTVAIFFAVLGLLFLTLNFMLKSNKLPDTIVTKLPIGIGNILFGIPLCLFIYLLVKRYKVMKLGFTTKPVLNLLLGLIIWGITGVFAYFFNKEGMFWEKLYRDDGIIGGIITIITQGIIGAALFEEFSRFIVQSRFEKIFKTNGINILFATTIWAFMHFPVTYYKNDDVISVFIYCIQIIPIGFIWGYLTQRTKSIVPATITHGMNLWGIQNG
jgi:membrane protease YdiL (CAAX protease family)